VSKYVITKLEDCEVCSGLRYRYVLVKREEKQFYDKMPCGGCYGRGLIRTEVDLDEALDDILGDAFKL
jgi:hypothetical protein